MKKKDEIAYYEALASFEDQKKRQAKSRLSSICSSDDDHSPEATIKQIFNKTSIATPLFKKSAKAVHESQTSLDVDYKNSTFKIDRFDPDNAGLIDVHPGI